MRVAYVAGPYRDTRGAWFVRENIRRAEAVALELWRMGYAVVCPHLNTALMDGALPDDVWLTGGIEIMRRCDLVVLLPGWEESRGTLAEIAAAENEGLRVLEWGVDDGLLRMLATTPFTAALRGEC